MTELTVSELADRVRREDEDETAAVDRLRNWTKEGLLQTLGEKNPGRGKHRRYSEDAVVDAAILSLLTDRLGMPAVRTREFKEAFNLAKEWFRKPRSAQYLVFSLSDRQPSIATSKPEFLGETIAKVQADIHLVLDLKQLHARLNRARE